MSLTLTVSSLNGHDLSATRGNPFHPFKTIAAALAQTRDGDRLEIRDGPYAEQGLVLRYVNGVTIAGIGQPVITASTRGHILRINSCNDLSVTGLKFNGTGPITEPNELYFALVELQSVNDRLSFSDCQFTNSGNHGLAHLAGPRTSSNVTVDRCSFERGGNYGRTQNLIWDGAAIAVGGIGIRIRRTRIKDWPRGIEFENPYGDCTFYVDNCDVSECAHAGLFITPTGPQNNISRQHFTGKILNSRFTNGKKVPGGFLASGMVISGGQDVLLSGNTVSDFPDGCGIECSAKWGPLSRFIISNNHVTNIGRSGILFRHGPDGTKSLADGLVCANNILANISGAPIDFLAYNIQESCNLLPPLQVES